MWLVNRMSMMQKDAFSSFWRFYDITPISGAHLDLEGGDLQHDGHTGLQTVAQTRVLVQREHAEGDVLARYASRHAPSPTSFGEETKYSLHRNHSDP